MRRHVSNSRQIFEKELASPRSGAHARAGSVSSKKNNPGMREIRRNFMEQASDPSLFDKVSRACLLG